MVGAAFGVVVQGAGVAGVVAASLGVLGIMVWGTGRSAKLGTSIGKT